MTTYSVAEFVNNSISNSSGTSPGSFSLKSTRMLQISLDGMAWIKTGSMVGYVGEVKLTREGIFEHGLAKMLKKSLTGEGTKLTKAEGYGGVLLADQGKKVTILNLEGETITVNGKDLLAFESTVEWDIKMFKKISSQVMSGFYNVRLGGYGMVAISTHYDPVALPILEDTPVYTDPGATVAWSGHLEPSFKVDMAIKTLVGRGSGDTIQMCFTGEGFVVIQPYEDWTDGQPVYPGKR